MNDALLEVSKPLFNDFEWKLKVAKSLKKKYPDAEIGFFHKKKHFSIIEGDN